MEIEILCTKLIKPSSPTLSHNQCYKLSFFDQIAEREHLPVVLFYHYNNFNSPTIDEQLEKSLSNVLTHVYPAAGRYDKDECSILCLYQGVPYTKAKVNCNLDNFLEKAHKDLSLAALFWPHENKNVDQNNFMVSPIVTIQVTKFECGGLALSFSVSHPAIDGFTCFNFLFGWGKVCRLGTPIDKINFLSFNLGHVFPTRDISGLFKSTHVENREENIVVKRFVIHEAALSRLRKQCIDESGGALNFQPSRVEIITAILWRALIRISAARNGYFRSSLMDFPLNLRSKSSLPQVNNSMGNFRIDVPIKFIPGKTTMELHNFIILIRNTVNKVVASCANASPDEIVSTLVNIYNESFEAPEWGGNDEVDKVACSSMCKFPLQDIDFGLGKPSLVYFGLKDMEIFWLYDTDCHTEVGVQLDLKESCMQLFECDNDIKALRNTVNKVVASCANASPDEIVSTLVNIYNESFEAPEWGGNDEVDKVACSSMCKFPLQDIDFGLGKPSLVYFGLKDMEIFWFYDTDCHTEVGVQLDLKESCMQLFECDNDIKALIFIRDAKL